MDKTLLSNEKTSYNIVDSDDAKMIETVLRFASYPVFYQTGTSKIVAANTYQVVDQFRLNSLYDESGNIYFEQADKDKLDFKLKNSMIIYGIYVCRFSSTANCTVRVRVNRNSGNYSTADTCNAGENITTCVPFQFATSAGDSFKVDVLSTSTSCQIENSWLLCIGTFPSSNDLIGAV